MILWLRKHETQIEKILVYIGGFVLLCVMLAGCAMNEGYWIKVRNPSLIRGIVFTPTPGGRPDLLGYANLSTGMIEMKPDLPPALAHCVYTHEAKHFAGYTHDPRPGFATDCGDGTIL